MSQERSVAPKERVNITYKPATGDAQEDVELPFKMLVVGDFTGQDDARSIEERKPINVNKDTFASVMAEQNLGLNLVVPDRLSGDSDADLPLALSFSSMKDMAPEGIAAQVPEVRTLMDLRHALTALKGPLGNVPAFRRKIQQLLEDEDSRSRLVAELGLDLSPQAEEDSDD